MATDCHLLLVALGYCTKLWLTAGKPHLTNNMLAYSMLVASCVTNYTIFLIVELLDLNVYIYSYSFCIIVISGSSISGSGTGGQYRIAGPCLYYKYISHKDLFHCSIAIVIHSYHDEADAVHLWTLSFRNEDPKERPQYYTIMAQLSNTKNALSWSDEDKLINEESATVLGNPLSDSYNLFYDLQLKYRNSS